MAACLWQPVADSLGIQLADVVRHPDSAPLKFCLHPSLPLGGRLSHFVPFWEGIAADTWVLSVVKHGYQIDLVSPPPSMSPRFTRLREGEDVLVQEVAELLDKGAVEVIPPEQPLAMGFYSTYFLVPKKDGGIRPILNLKPFNAVFVKKQSFKMETLQAILPTLPLGCWMASLDLKDAYFHVPIHPSHWKLLRFAIAGAYYQYKVLPFGLSLAPLVFTRVLGAVVSHLRSQGVQLHAYLDDLLVLASDPEQLRLSLMLVMRTLCLAGYTLNLKKSDLAPTQDLVYIGGRLRTDLGRVFLPVDRREALLSVVRVFARVGLFFPAKAWMRLLGLMAASIISVRLARLRMRPIQSYFMAQWRSRDLNHKIMVPLSLMECFRWWLCADNLSEGMPFRSPQPSLTITTDASREGWGGHVNFSGQSRLFSGLWSLKERSSAHINLLELRAVFLMLRRVEGLLRGLTILVECDNTTAVAYLNKQGGTRSQTLCQEAIAIHEWLIVHQASVVAVHRPGVDNQLADFLSRTRPDPTEWSLADSVCACLWRKWGRPQVDVFASHLNHKLPVWFSRLPHKSAHGTDALRLSWADLEIYAFPPFNLIQRTLVKIRDERVRKAIVVLPHWPKRLWYNLVTSLAVSPPFPLPLREDVLSQFLPDKGVLFHPDFRSLHLTAWMLSGRRGR